MRILQVNKLYYPWIGGVETVVQDIAESFNKKEGVVVENLVCQPRGKRVVEKVNSGQKVNRTVSLRQIKAMRGR